MNTSYVIGDSPSDYWNQLVFYPYTNVTYTNFLKMANKENTVVNVTLINTGGSIKACYC